ncbi:MULTISPECIES: bifunctional isocitrate dehydrogenase kinase/phosphatase [unclassified Undibacterium]|uniref:bifunctional isocitrate dehydrogenase kinase/phosphatase n=1 Tax=unclassified Undibacterium TaxID=2630295 RepID=UPI00164B23A8|nr:MULTISPECIES: bifunctional isocitrate dehydrogenase kinase/phosphatase [unclassified Undibacterium]MBC3877683.1 bifunctional isocitrate dehydrogenase kinase/phosphatase [Undibacterium sp. FT79W]MBC3928622.1 bifunctional isocitrate dehydrogenase kinase/phosphatase [Undibacterium sp. CY21W]MBK1890369.1 bifunctional isocitrate dehydrogenase kinase/phosphatase [Undibacterium sp. 14-3-2]
MPNTHFPKLLSSQIAFDIARTILDGFDKHYHLFRISSQQAKQFFEAGDWKAAQIAARERIQFYDTRVRECVRVLEDDYDENDLTDEVWREVKLHYMGLLIDHLRPELAETFFNTVCTKLLNRNYFHNDFIFVRPATSTEYIERDDTPPTYRVYYPATDGLNYTIKRIVTNFQLNTPFEDLDRDVAVVEARLREHFGREKLEPNHQIQVLANLFYRNKSAYIIGKGINGNREYPFVIPLMHKRKNELVLDTILFDVMQITVLFSFTRAYFMVDMEVPSAYVQFIRSILPKKPRSEIYTMIGLQKHGKNLFYRDFLHHLKYSSDRIEAAPGIRGLVMLVFALPSFPYVFKLIKDSFPPPKETTRALIKEKYLLVKNHDRVGRMADTLEYSDVAFPRSRFSEELLEEIRQYAPSMLEVNDEEVVIKHLYIERRMTPLNIWLTEAEQRGDMQAMEQGVLEYGNAIKDLVSANIFPGDMLYKNFGVTRHGRVVFYDYDEIEYITDCTFRKIPLPRNEEDEMSAEPWYPIAKNDVFPEQFGTFLLGNQKVKEFFMKHHADLLTADYWQGRKLRIVDGKVDDVFPYPQEVRFINKELAQQK